MDPTPLILIATPIGLAALCMRILHCTDHKRLIQTSGNVEEVIDQLEEIGIYDKPSMLAGVYSALSTGGKYSAIYACVSGKTKREVRLEDECCFELVGKEKSLPICIFDTILNWNIYDGVFSAFTSDNYIGISAELGREGLEIEGRRIRSREELGLWGHTTREGEIIPAEQEVMVVAKVASSFEKYTLIAPKRRGFGSFNRRKEDIKENLGLDGSVHLLTETNTILLPVPESEYAEGNVPI